MPTEEMIRVKLVSAHVANRMLASHLCQSKNSEVLNTFHPESGGGARSAIRKSVEEESVCQFLRLGCAASRGVQGCCCHGGMTGRQGSVL